MTMFSVVTPARQEVVTVDVDVDPVLREFALDLIRPGGESTREAGAVVVAAADVTLVDVEAIFGKLHCEVDQQRTEALRADRLGAEAAETLLGQVL